MNSKFPLKIALGDLRHKTIGRHSVLMPIGIGYITSYMLTQVDKNNVKIRLYDNADIILRDIRVWNPDVVALSNYCWNSELSKIVFRFAKKANPSVVCIAGGPEFPIEKLECKKYLSLRPEIDFYIYFEGEIAFSYLIQKIIKGTKTRQLRSNPQEGIMSIHPNGKKLIFGKSLPRFTKLDVIPSPYLNGLMEQYFNGYYAPSIQTMRGCPFSCGYCLAGNKWFSSLATFSVRRVKKELSYIAQRMKNWPNILLSICDANFGMYERDEEIAKHCRNQQDKYSWPNAFDVSTGKANYKHILKITAILKNKIYITSSLQSLNPKTLEIIRRKNITIDKFMELQAEIKKRGMLSMTELITPMPAETKSSFFEGMKTVINAGIERIVVYTTMLLKGTYLASAECRKKFKMQTRFRILPRQFGEYLGEKCFEIEEVCVATNTMSYRDYLDIRGFVLVSSFFSSEQFDIVRKHLKDLKISPYEYYYYLWELIKSGKTSLSAVYKRYLIETEKELFSSRQAIYEYMKDEKNYNKLLTEELGDNLIRKYNTKLLLETVPAIELAYSSLLDMAYRADKETLEALNTAKHWMIETRNLKTVFNKYNGYMKVNKIIHLPFDVYSWYRNKSEPLISYRKQVSYRIFYDRDKLNTILNQGEKLYSGDLFYAIGKLLINYDIENFWTQCEKLKK